MSSIVVEFEGFQVHTYDFIIKEMAFYSVDLGYHSRWSFLPPCPCEELPIKKRKKFSWLPRNYHGLSWNCGELPYSTLELVLSSLFSSNKNIYTKGLEKTKFLEKKSGRRVFNLDDVNCPKFILLEGLPAKCPMHSKHFKHCALAKASVFAKYIKDRTSVMNVICVQDVNIETSQIA